MKYNAGVIGCGRIGSLLSEDKLREKPCTHAESLFKNNNIQLIAGADLDLEKLNYFSNKWGVKKVYTDYKLMLEENKFDIISIATPPSTHLEIVEKCVEHKVKIILCEKPISTNIKDAEKIVSLCKLKDTLLIINHSRRFSIPYIKVRDLLKSDALGKLKTICCNISTGAPKIEEDYKKNGGGILIHDGIHVVDTVKFLLGDIEPSDIYAQIKFAENGAKVEQNLQCIMNYQDGLCVFIDCSDRDYFHFEIDIQGDKGRITIGNGIQKYYIKAESPYYENFNSLIEKPFPEYNKVPFFEVLIDSIVKYLKTGEIPESTGDIALSSFKQVMAIYKSAVLNKRITYPVKISHHPFDKVFEDINIF